MDRGIAGPDYTIRTWLEIWTWLVDPDSENSIRAHLYLAQDAASARSSLRRSGAMQRDVTSRGHAALPRAKVCTSAVVSALPPIPQSPLSTSSTTHQVTPRMFSPSIETMASVSLVMI